MPLLRRHGLAVPFVLLLAVLCTWPAAPLALSGQALVGHPVGDTADHFWGQAWLQGGLLGGHWPTVAQGLFFPEERLLWHVDPLGALLSLPVAWLGPVRAWNLLLLAQVGLAGLAAWAAAWDLLGTRRAAMVSATAVAVAPYLGGLLHSGLSEYLGLAPVVVGVWGLLRASGRDPQGRPPSLGWALVAAMGWGLAGVQAPYYLVFLGLFGLCLLPGGGLRFRVAPLGLAALGAALVAAPTTLSMGRILASEASAVQAHTAPGWSYAAVPAVDLLSQVHPTFLHPDTPALGNPGILQVGYLGLVGLGLGLWALVRQERLACWRLPAGLFGLFMLGPRLSVGGGAPWGLELPLPMALLYLPGSPLAAVHHPYRVAAVAVVGLALLAGAALARSSWRVAGLGVLLLAIDGLLLPVSPWPRATMEVGLPEVYGALPEGAVVDWPPDATTWNRRYTARQVLHGHPIPYGLNEFLPRQLRADPLVRSMLRALDDPKARARNRDVPFAGGVVVSAAGASSRLWEWGYRAVVVHPEALSERELQRTRALLGAQLGEPEEIDGDWLYRLVEPGGG